VTPETLAAQLGRAASALATGRLDEVEGICAQVLRKGEEANALMLAGLARIARGRAEEGVGLLERARRANPRHVHVLSNLGSAYRRTGRLPEARAALEAAIGIDPGLAAAHCNLGHVLADLGDRDAAASHYRRAAQLVPDFAEPLAALAEIAESRHDLVEARGLADRALDADPRNAAARLVRGKVLLRDGDAQAAIGELETLLTTDTTAPSIRVLAHGHLGDAFDALGEFDRAFASYTAANEIQHEQFASAYASDRGFMSPPAVERMLRIVGGADPGRWPRARDPRPSPVFLVGFPRSGTTLLEQVLASHPDIVTLEERDTLVDSCQRLLLPGMGAADWEGLRPEDAADLRERYWARVAGFLPETGRPPVVIDKYPLHAVLLPLIHFLFPDARIVLALRDPRDVVLSCYRQRFGMNGAMYQLLRLDTAAAYYDRVMELVERSRQRLPLQVHELRYEELVADFDGTVGSLLAFLRVPWSDAVRDYAATAARREIRTPSATQVVKPIYRSSQGRWHHYRRQLEPVLPRLDRWAARLGYTVSGPP
jgi:tetratricopeptide (TPR) repeat protein